ncbi:valine--tRNA ligase [Cardinium endosymbiont of Culicoides punctatus]|uniref:valine--tRNA ligase n=1 Tax=Cardinium endosymbiont of Culicoides punctatus TaxID=2304601 RepID=UPI0010DE2D1E|nr:valine--tRNA ligase [Cardinium endosymbiont of Culicoides punctatus]TDG94749.1 Valine--tRNA ligase [Cardinium endosymbiont of Culicoides punctatus]
MTISPLPQYYNFLEREKHWQDFWIKKNVYAWDPKSSREDTFVVDTPPPTVSGNLHIGHACSYTQADFIVRFQRMLGKNIFYPIGFDDNGLPTERLVEKQKNVRATNLSREDFIALCQEVVAVEEEKFRVLFKSMALSVDWALEYQTISPPSRKLSQMSFLDLLAKGEIYRSEQPMLWDPVDGTALAQADIEDKERDSYMNDIIFHHEPTHEPLHIATTRPELLPACVALFFHPDDARYQHLLHSYAITPLFNIRVPIRADSLVQPDKGTGLVMCCTFGDQTDILWWKKHQLPTKIILNKQGIITADHAGPIKGLKVTAARATIIERLKEESLLVKQTKITQFVKCAERSGAPLEILTTPQWFIRTLEHKEALLTKTNELQWHPASMKHRLDTWINGISWDWCISRQRYFGVPFPVWYAKRSGEEGKILLPTIDQLPVNPLIDLPIGYTKEEVEPDYDVMDTWATSSISPQLSSQAISNNFSIDYKRHSQLFPMDLRPQAHEIIRTWAFYTLLKAHLHEDRLPWKNIMINGWCLAPDRDKMSKSKGNIIAPETLLHQYGADVIRYWSASARLGADTCYCENVMKNGKRLITKLWNAGKFIAQHFPKIDHGVRIISLSACQEKITHTLDKWLLHFLAILVEEVRTDLLAYGYTEALERIEKFFWSVFCDDYLEMSKSRAYNEDHVNDSGQWSAILTLYHTFYCLLQLFAPILPHITEELAQRLYPHKESIHTRGSWPSLQFNSGLSSDQVNQVDQLREVMNLVRKAKADHKLSIKAPIQLLTISGSSLTEDLLQDLKTVSSAREILFATTLDDPYFQVKGKQCSISVQFE